MAEKLLHATQVGAVVEHVGCEAVAQGMRTDRRIQARVEEVFVQLATDTARAQALAVLVHEQRLLVEVRAARVRFAQF